MTDRERDGLSGLSRSIAISVYITLSKQGSVSFELAMLDDEEGMQVTEDSEQGGNDLDSDEHVQGPGRVTRILPEDRLEIHL